MTSFIEAQTDGEVDLWFKETMAVLNDHLNSAAFRESVKQSADFLENSLLQNSLIVTCGNGGSSAEASHFVAELAGRFSRIRRPLPALCISDSSYVTCAANDFGYEEVFSRTVESLAGIQMVLVCFSTSGESRNVVNAAARARSMGIPVLSFSGFANSPLSLLSDIAIEVSSSHSGLVQQVHQIAMHAVCAQLDTRFSNGIEKN